MWACVCAMLLPAVSSSAILQANARGMACAQWNAAGSGVPKDCVWNTPTGSSQPAGSPWLGVVDPATGACTAIPGVTEAIGNMQSVHGNFIAPDPARPLSLLGFTNPNFTYYTTSITLPESTGEKGSVNVLSKMEPSAWMEAGTSNCVLSWSFLEMMSTGGSFNLTEMLSCVAPLSLKATSLWSNSSSPAEGSVPPAYFGAERAVDVASGVLYTQSENQSLGRFDIHTKKAMARLETSAKRFSCLHYDPVEKRLGGIVSDVSVSPSATSVVDVPGGTGGDMELVSIDIATGGVTTRLKMPDFPPVVGGLDLFYLDRSMVPGDSFSPVSRPACTFDGSTGELVFLLVDEDKGVKPAFANKALYVSSMDTRKLTVPSAPAKIEFPFTAAVALGNRTWRPTMPGLSFL